MTNLEKVRNFLNSEDRPFTIEALATASGVDKAAISRIKTGISKNPRANTLDLLLDACVRLRQEELELRRFRKQQRNARRKSAA